MGGTAGFGVYKEVFETAFFKGFKAVVLQENNAADLRKKVSDVEDAMQREVAVFKGQTARLQREVAESKGRTKAAESLSDILADNLKDCHKQLGYALAQIENRDAAIKSISDQLQNTQNLARATIADLLKKLPGQPCTPPAAFGLAGPPPPASGTH